MGDRTAAKKLGERAQSLERRFLAEQREHFEDAGAHALDCGRNARGVDQRRGHAEGAQQLLSALAQGQGREAFDRGLICHIHKKDTLM